uniref:Merozoite antigen n=1 Tax=Theileria equi TaxID=5872 RepID=H1A7A8_THEEQ|nr:merozoite antigen [Theileria equi]
MKVFVFSVLLLGYPNFFCSALRGSNELTLDIDKFPDPIDIVTEKQNDLTIYKPYDPNALKNIVQGDKPIWFKKRGEKATKVVVYNADDAPSIVRVHFKAGDQDQMNIYYLQGDSWALKGTYDPDQPGSPLSGENPIPEREVPDLQLDITAAAAKGVQVNTFVSCNIPTKVFKVAPGAVIRSLAVGETAVWANEKENLKESKVYQPKGANESFIFTAVIDGGNGKNVTKFFKKEGAEVKELAKNEFEKMLKEFVDQEVLENAGQASGDL